MAPELAFRGDIPGTRGILHLQAAARVIARVVGKGKCLKLGYHETPIDRQTTVIDAAHVPYANNQMPHDYTRLAVAFLAGVERVDGGVQNLLRMSREIGTIEMDTVLGKFKESDVPEYLDFDAVFRLVQSLSDSTILRIGWFLQDGANGLGGDALFGETCPSGDSFLCAAGLNLPNGRVTVSPKKLPVLMSMPAAGNPLRIMGLKLQSEHRISRLGFAWRTHVLTNDGFGRERVAVVVDEGTYSLDPLMVEDISFRDGKVYLKLRTVAKNNFEIPYSLDELKWVKVTTAPDPRILAE
jgi:hypothetical protein